MKKIICISLVFGCGKPNSVVQRESDVSAVSIPKNQTNPEKQYSINEETNLQEQTQIVPPTLSNLRLKVGLWISIAVSVVSAAMSQRNNRKIKK
ncbi:hypothetical protein [Candidatus Endomicrobiellum agilis]|uniref:hypothetical protein n=1 Tax=Candidatus Endomicrobiellum agilis TaxID=3238957 RepID=UPI0035875203|nr:hypothetical protein [Endomicrobium sp.]